jgi:hypothetical protein
VGDRIRQTGNFEARFAGRLHLSRLTSSSGAKWRREVFARIEDARTLLSPKAEFPVYQGKYREFRVPMCPFSMLKIA